ncbi:MAG: hypothetical protein IH948_10335 [Bacteroidetes bacterium]|nr:hypothetical protein [Bacteroidota bacterium]
MSVVERIRDRQKSNRELLNILRSQLTIDDIQNIKLSDFAKLDCAIQIYSEFLGSEIWLCSNEEMVKEIKTDDHEAVTYTIEEMKHLLTLKVSPEEIRRIHYAKNVFNGSKIVDCSLDGGIKTT